MTHVRRVLLEARFGPQWRALVPWTLLNVQFDEALRSSEAGSSVFAAEFFERLAREAGIEESAGEPEEKEKKENSKGYF